MKKLIQTVESMKGGVYLYGRQQHYIVDFTINEGRGRFFLKTDKNTYDRPIDAAMEFLEQFEKVPDRDLLVNPPASDQKVVLPALTVDQRVTEKLKDVLLDNITKIQADKSYIPQAEAIKSSVESVLGIAKLEIEYLNAVNRLKGGRG